MVTLLDREGKAVELDAPCWKLGPNRVETLMENSGTKPIHVSITYHLNDAESLRGFGFSAFLPAMSFTRNKAKDMRLYEPKGKIEFFSLGLRVLLDFFLPGFPFWMPRWDHYTEVEGDNPSIMSEAESLRHHAITESWLK